jgi:NADH-quinone oxidoreductase subunit N
MLTDLLILMKQEMVLTGIIFMLLLIKVGSKEWANEQLLNVVQILLLINLLSGFFFATEGKLFGDMFKTDALITLQKNILNIGTYIISLLAYSWLKEHKHALEFYVLLLCTLLGMFFMLSSANLLIFYIGLELSTIPLAALANFDLEKKQSSEAAMKMIISSAFSSGLLLMGISFIYGTTGSLDFVGITAGLNNSPLQIFAFILLLAGFAFKISAVPFHLWTADVYQGAPIAVTAYLSVISKAAVLFVFVTVLFTVFKPMADTWYFMVMLLSMLTIVVGNLFAIRQENIKRFLAFSSIAQVGFILIGIAGTSTQSVATVIYFLLIYIFSNLAAFGVIAVVSAATGRENITDFKGFYKTNPVLSWTLAIALFSLAGVPPTAGFFGKFFLLFAGATKGHYIFLVIAALNMVISLFYYLKIVKAMFMDANEQPITKISIPALPGLGLAICTIGIVITGLFSWIYDYIFSLSSNL